MGQRGAGVHQPEQHARPCLHAHRLAGAEHPAVDRIGFELDVHGALAAQRRLPFVQHQRHVGVVGAGIVGVFHHHHAELAGVGALPQIAAGRIVAVVPARAGGLGREHIAAPAFRRRSRGALFVDAVDLGRDVEAVPVHEVLGLGVVEDVHGQGTPARHAQQRARHLAVVGHGRHDATGRDLVAQRADAQRHVGRAGEFLRGLRWMMHPGAVLRAAGRATERHCARGEQPLTSGHGRTLPWMAMSGCAHPASTSASISGTPTVRARAAAPCPARASGTTRPTSACRATRARPLRRGPRCSA